MILDTFALMKLMYHSDSKKWTKGLSFNIFIITNSNKLTTTSFVYLEFTIHFTNSEDLAIAILKGKNLLLCVEPNFDYFFLFTFSVLSPTNEFPGQFNILENIYVDVSLV